MRICTVVLLLLGVASAQEGKTYAIRMDRPAKTGERYRLAARGSVRTSNVTRISGTVVQEEAGEWSAELEGVVRLLDVSEEGDVRRLSCQVRRLVRSEGGEQKDLGLAGKTVLLDKSGLELEDGALTDEAREALDLLLETDTEGVNNDDAFGTNQPRRIGETWPIDAGAVAKNLALEDMQIPPEKIEGSMTLVGLESREGVECMKIAGRITANGFAIEGVPQGMTTQHSELEVSVSGLLPVETERRAVLESVSMRMNAVVGGDGADVTVTHHQNRHAEYGPAPE